MILCGNTLLSRIRNYAADAHGSQTRKYTKDPYIVHPERVSKTCAEYTEDVSILAAALLHDVLEDTNVTAAQLEAFLNTLMDPPKSKKIVGMVEELTDLYTKENFPAWNRNKRKRLEAERLKSSSPGAQTVKYADILDNCPEISMFEPEFAKRYCSECLHLLKAMQNGDPRLRAKALSAVKDGIDKINRPASGNGPVSETSP
jgi:(p)ppGpp synthase/HD superfamily hydrolase